MTQNGSQSTLCIQNNDICLELKRKQFSRDNLLSKIIFHNKTPSSLLYNGRWITRFNRGTKKKNIELSE